MSDFLRRILVLPVILLVSMLHGQSGLQERLLQLDEESVSYSPSRQKTELRRLEKEAVRYGDAYVHGNILRRLGILYLHEGQLDSSLSAYLKALELHHGIGEKLGQVSTLNNLSIIYYRLGQLEEALKSFRSMYRLAEEIGHDEMTEAAALNLSQIYFENDSLNQALYYLEKAEKVIRKSGSVVSLPHVLNLRGLIALERRDVQSALLLFQEASILFEAQRNQYGLALSLQNKARSFAVAGESDSAGWYFLRAMDTAFQSGDPAAIIEIADNFSLFHRQNGDSTKALQYLMISRQFQDSLLNEAGIKALIDAEKRYAGEAKSRDIEEQKEELAKRNLYLIILTLVLFSIMCLFVFYRRLKRQREELMQVELRQKSLEIDRLMNSLELKNLQAQVQGQNEERERISRELHDRLGSILTNIRLQFSSFEGKFRELEGQVQATYKDMTGMLNDAYEEVRRISHDLGSGTLERFGFKAAIHSLMEAIHEVNQIRIEFIDNNTDPALYKGMAEPLYRITQELLGNTLKHAGATEIHIQINCHENTLYFSYEDNGRGMNPEKLKMAAGIGIRNIETRVQMLNGTYSFDSTPGHGFTAIIEIPL